jgi:hypothetical protein
MHATDLSDVYTEQNLNEENHRCVDKIYPQCVFRTFPQCDLEHFLNVYADLILNVYM